MAIQFHRLTMSRHIDPTLTTLRADNVGMAEKAIESLQLRFDDRSLPSRQSVYVPELMARESGAAPLLPTRGSCQKRRLAWCGRRKAA